VSVMDIADGPMARQAAARRVERAGLS